MNLKTKYGIKFLSKSKSILIAFRLQNPRSMDPFSDVLVFKLAFCFIHDCLGTRYIEVTTTLENVETKEEIVYDAAAGVYASAKADRRAREEEERRQREQEEAKRLWEKEKEAAEQNGLDGGRKPFAQTDLDAVMVMSDKDDSDKAGNISAPLENGMHEAINRDGVILPNLPTTNPEDATNTFPDANQNEPFNTSEAPAELNVSVKGAEPEAFDFDAPGGSITAPNLNGTLQQKVSHGRA